MISLCMLSSDDTCDLARQLGQIRPFVDEIIIVTAESACELQLIAHNYGAVLVTEPFVDFGYARNTALRHASGEWVLVIDLDEEIEDQELDKLSKLAKRDDCAGYLIPRYDYIGRCGWKLSRPCRFFRRLSSISYDRPIYEEPAFPPYLTKHIKVCWDMAIHHYGYRQTETVLLKKRTFYINLLERHLKITNSFWPGVSLAYLYADSGDVSHALEAISGYSHSRLPQNPFALLAHAQILLLAGRTRNALDIIDSTIGIYSNDSYLQGRMQNIRGLALSHLGDIHGAILAFRNALRLESLIAAYSVNLALMLARLGNQAASKSLFSSAIKINPRITKERAKFKTVEKTYQDYWLHRLDTDPSLGEVLLKVAF